MVEDKDVKAFRKHVRALNRLMVKIKEDNPDANWYLQEDSLHLMIGPSHAGYGEVAQYHNSVASQTLHGAGGGGW